LSNRKRHITLRQESNVNRTEKINMEYLQQLVNSKRLVHYLKSY